jgi:uncharacterized protein YxjI
MQQQLPPINPPINIFGHVSHGETLVLKEKIKSLTGDSFDIRDATGQTYLTVKGKLASLSGRKSVYDGKTHLFDICKEHVHIHSTYVVTSPTDEKILEVKSNFKSKRQNKISFLILLILTRLIKVGGSKATATLFPGTPKELTFTMKGGWFDTSADIVCTDAVVARIDRKMLNAREVFGDQQTYALICAPGIDKALMVAMCIAFDEKNNEG